jgi:hypothetical protein
MSTLALLELLVELVALALARVDFRVERLKDLLLELRQRPERLAQVVHALRDGVNRRGQREAVGLFPLGGHADLEGFLYRRGDGTRPYGVAADIRGPA